MNRYFRSLVALLLTLFLMASLVPAPAAAASNSLSEEEAIELLQNYTIVRGDPVLGLDLPGKLTRAQAAALFVRVLNQDVTATALADLVPFTDAKGHWAAGEITLAYRLGLMRGDSEEIFRPNDEITYAEVLTVLLRIVGKEPEGAWDRGKIMAEAAKHGMAPSGVSATENAVRGKLFWALAVAISDVPLASGETVLQKHLDRVPPTLAVDTPPATTANEKIEITGTAVGAAHVLVGERKAKLDRKTGRFTHSADLVVGNNSLVITAVDWAGNETKQTVTIERQGQVSRIEITGPAMVKTGSTTTLEVVAYDPAGKVLPLEGIKAELTGDIATFDLTKSTLRAGDKPGRGTLTLTAGRVKKTYTFDVRGPAASAASLVILPVNNGVAPGIAKEYTVKVQVVDADNKVLTDDYFRSITLRSEGGSGVVIKESRVDTQAGVATFTMSSSRKADTTLTATASGLTEAQLPLQFLPSPRVVLTSTVSTLTPDGTSFATIRAALQDDSGRSASNKFADDIIIRLATTGTDGELTDNELTIRRGSSSSSGDEARFQVGIRPGTAKITGAVVSGDDVPIQTLLLPVTGNLAGAKLQITVPSGNQAPNGAAIPVTVKVLDSRGRVVTNGSYAFQIAVTTSNEELPSPTLPEGVEFTFADAAYYPVDDGKAPSSSLNDTMSVVGRTYQGVATLSLKYNKSGTISLTPKLVAANDDAYHPTSGFGPASGSVGMEATASKVTFAATATRVQLTVDSALGKDLPGGALAAGSGEMIIRARAVDANGYPVPNYSGSAVLTRSSTGDQVTRFAGTTTNNQRQDFRNGIAEWRIQRSGDTGFDVYSAAVGNFPAASVVVAVRDTKLTPPTIAAIRGWTEGDSSPELGYVGPKADYMDIQLAVPDLLEAGPSYWVSVKVYRKGESSAFFSAAAIDLMQDPPIVRIPKSSLNKTGKYAYEVTVHNGYGESLRSPDPGLGLDQAVNAIYNNNYRLTATLFDAQTGKLVLSASGINSSGRVDLNKLAVVKGDQRVLLADATTSSISLSSSSITVPASDLPTLLNADVYNGNVVIEAADGWFKSGDDSQIALASRTSLVKPMAVIDFATFEESTKRLYLHGSGFSHGTVDVGQIHLGDITLRPGTGSSSDVVTTSATTDTQVTIALSQTTLDALKAAESAVVLTADVGWLKVTSGGATYHSLPITGDSHRVYVRLRVTSAEYDRSTNTLTLRGAGFTGLTVHPQKLVFRNSTKERRLDDKAEATVVDNSTLTIQLSDGDAGYFESTSGFHGKEVFMNTDGGWAVDQAGRQVAPVPTDNILFEVPRS